MYTSLEEFDDGSGMSLQYAVANTGTPNERPHSASVSNITEFDIVMGSQVSARMVLGQSCKACPVRGRLRSRIGLV